jgi:pantoate--beta-alanine ligase
MEGAFRPGHFRGVVQIVYRLFELVKPNKAFFGLKDFQQVAVIKHMVQYLKLPFEIVTCATARSADGLALSSRNMRLSETQKEDALHIFRTLRFCADRVAEKSPRELQTLATDFFNQGSMKLEYLQVVHPKTLDELTEEWVPGATICIACYCGDVRLIDNLMIVPEK